MLSEIDDATLVATATKSENAPITKTFEPSARPIQCEPVYIACKVVDLYGVLQS